jgi:hypothetical protein
MEWFSISLHVTPFLRECDLALALCKVLRTNAASSAKKLSAQVLCTSAAHMREHALPAFVRTLNARCLSSFSALIECDLKFTCSAFLYEFLHV